MIAINLEGVYRLPLTSDRDAGRHTSVLVGSYFVHKGLDKSDTSFSHFEGVPTPRLIFGYVF